MRRSTPGALNRDTLRPAHIAHIDADPARAIEVLEPLVLERRKTRIREVLARRLSSVTVIFDRPYDPHNGAAVVRSCDAFGVQTLRIVERHDVSFLAAATVARGAEKWVDVHTYDGAEEALADVPADRFQVVGAHPGGELNPADLRHFERLCIVVGNERDGISPALEAACQHRVRVPMRGFVESLNVSVTTAILLHAATEGRPGDLDDATLRRLYARGLYHSYPSADRVLFG